MAPPIVLPATPSDFISPYPITATDMAVTVFPTGPDDWGTLPYVLNNMANKPGAVITLAGGQFFSRYQLLGLDFDGTIQGSGPNSNSTTLTAGTPNQRMLPLDPADSAVYNPNGLPSLLAFRRGRGG